jgi:molybdenum cofactor synthesis domain-containing protein
VAGGADVIFTSGGTGIGPRDVTPETIRAVLDREIPGVMEYIRVKYGRTKPSALLSRSVAGVIGSTLVYALPGSVRAVREYLAEILRSLEHAVLTVRGIDLHG